MMEDRFVENDPAPLFLVDPIDEAEQSGVRKMISSEAFRKGVLIFGAASTVFAVVWVVNAILFAGAPTSGAGARAPRDSGSQSTAAIQSASSPSSSSPSSDSASTNSDSSNTAQASPANDTAPAASPATPAGDQLLAAFKAAVENKPAVETKAEADQPGAESVLNQFKAWAAEEDVQPPARQPEPPPAVQAARAEVVQAARSEVVPLPKRRPTNFEAARPHDPAPPSLLRQLGWRNY